MSFTFAGQWGPDSITGSGGAPLPNDTVAVYEADGVTLATIYTDRTMGSTTSNPTNADLYGNLSIFAVPGQYVISGNGGTLNITVPVDPEDVGTGSGSVPIGDESKVTTPITYSDPISGDSIEVLTFSAETTAIAIAREGDDFPEFVYRPAGNVTRDSLAPILAFGDGTFDPATWTATDPGCGFQIAPLVAANTLFPTSVRIATPNSYMTFNETFGNVEGSTQVEQLAIAPSQYAQGSGSPVTIMVAQGDPNALTLASPYSGTGLPGNLNDLYINTNATGNTDWLWRCSVAGDIGAATWVEYSSGGGAVSSVFGRTGTVAATSGDYTVGQVTGAAPLASPSFTGTPVAPNQAALTNNFSIATTFYADAAVGVEKTRAQAAEALKAPLASPALTGTPTAPTASPLTGNTQVATTAYADSAVAASGAAAAALAAQQATVALNLFVSTQCS